MAKCSISVEHEEMLSANMEGKDWFFVTKESDHKREKGDNKSNLKEDTLHDLMSAQRQPENFQPFRKRDGFSKEALDLHSSSWLSILTPL